MLEELHYFEHPKILDDFEFFPHYLVAAKRTA